MSRDELLKWMQDYPELAVAELENALLHGWPTFYEPWQVAQAKVETLKQDCTKLREEVQGLKSLIHIWQLVAQSALGNVSRLAEEMKLGKEEATQDAVYNVKESSIRPTAETVDGVEEQSGKNVLQKP